MDEIAAPSETDDLAASPAGGSAKGPVRAYSPAVLSERQARVTDFLPVQPLWVVLSVLGGLAGVAAIETIDFYCGKLTLAGSADHLAAFDVRGRGSLAAWYSSALLAGAAVLALVVFGIRSHRVDDYRGAYRIWLWATAALAWLSLDAATGLHDALGFAATLLAGKQVLTASLAAACTVIWLALYLLVFGALGVRLAIELWPSLASFAALATGAVLYLCSGLMQLGVLAPADPLVATVVESTVTLVAHVSLLAATGLYARHVYLDAQGRLKVHIDPDKKRPKPKRSKLKVVKEDKAASEQATDKPVARPAAATYSREEPVQFGSTGGSSPKVGASISKGSLSSPEYDDGEDEEDDYGGERLSKSERRRLKKLARREQQRRAA